MASRKRELRARQTAIVAKRQDQCLHSADIDAGSDHADNQESPEPRKLEAISSGHGSSRCFECRIAEKHGPLGLDPRARKAVEDQAANGRDHADDSDTC